MPKIEDFRKGYDYREDGATGYGNRKPSPKPEEQSREGEIPAGWEHYDYKAPSDNGWGKGSK